MMISPLIQLNLIRSNAYEPVLQKSYHYRYTVKSRVATYTQCTVINLK